MKVDWQALTLTHNKVTVDLKNVLGWAFVNGPISKDQARLYAEQSYRKAAGIKLNEPCPEVNAAWADLGKAPVDDLYVAFKKESWILTSANGTRYQLNGKKGLVQLF